MPDPTDYEARLRATLGPLDGRCLRCKWTLAPNKREGCVPGNCAYRPGGNEQFTPAQVTVRAEDLADLIAEVKRLRAAAVEPGCEFCPCERCKETSE